ncbi:MAG: DUF4911 domain-containing protein [Desulfobacteraceae bacterium 4572_89]|nr:MAG: DUF4911 domain-containing protein [Desulfobacteraceae bacterium 4572_89]
MKSVHKFYRVDKTRIGFIKFIFEAHEGLALVSTLNSGDGRIRLSVSPDCLVEAGRVMDDLKKDIEIHDA